MPKQYIPKAEKTTLKLSLVEGAKAYAQLKKEIEREGILDRDYFYYVKLFLFVFLGFFLSLFFVFVSASFIAIVLSSVLVAFFAVQISGFFHDSGHRAIFKSSKNNDILGYFSCFFLAYVYKKWRVNHNKHHANPNEEDMDPDIERPMFSFNEKQMKSKKGIWKTISQLQLYTYYPIGSLTAIYAQLANIFYFAKEPRETKYWEKLLYAVGIFLWILGPLLAFGPAKASIFYLVAYPLMGIYLFNVFAPNHKGMPQIKKGQKKSFLEQQIITSRNLKGGLLTELFFMGLNYQIEHHLFTNCPRNKLKLVTPHVKKLCSQLGFEYTEAGLVETNKIILNELRQVALSA